MLQSSFAQGSNPVPQFLPYLMDLWVCLSYNKFVCKTFVSFHNLFQHVGMPSLGEFEQYFGSIVNQDLVFMIRCSDLDSKVVFGYTFPKKRNLTGFTRNKTSF